MRAPRLDPATAATVLGLLDHAASIVPAEHVAAYLRGYATARAWEPELPSRPSTPPATMRDRAIEETTKAIAPEL